MLHYEYWTATTEFVLTREEENGYKIVVICAIHIVLYDMIYYLYASYFYGKSEEGYDRGMIIDAYIW